MQNIKSSIFNIRISYLLEILVKILVKELFYVLSFGR